MPRFPKPWFRKERQAWFVQVGRQHVNLGADKTKALEQYHALMSQPQKPRVKADSVVNVIDLFLDWCQKHRAPETYEWYQSRLQLFVKTIPPELKTSLLRPFHVQQWIDGYEDLSSGSKRNHCRSVQRAMRWAEQQGYIDRSPIAYMEKPAAGKRDMVVSKAEFDQILENTKDRAFRDLLIVSWESGCRPQESLVVEARHVDLENTRWVFPPKEEKMGRVPRIVYLTETALEITARLKLQCPEGPIFRNTSGRLWTTDAVNCRFTTLEKKLGKRYCLYVFRHTWMNRLLTSGVDALTVAVLAGHSDPSTLAKTYQHLSQNPEYLRSAARRARA
jgi:integrase/recombinase XerD